MPSWCLAGKYYLQHYCRNYELSEVFVDVGRMKHQFGVLFAVNDVNQDDRWTKEDIDSLKSGAKLYIPEQNQTVFASMQDDIWKTRVNSESLATVVTKVDFMADMTKLFVTDKHELLHYVRSISRKVIESFVDINRDISVSKVELDNASVDFHVDLRIIDLLLPITTEELIGVLVKLYTMPGEDIQGRIVDEAVRGKRLM